MVYFYYKNIYITALFFLRNSNGNEAVHQIVPLIATHIHVIDKALIII